MSHWYMIETDQQIAFTAASIPYIELTVNPPTNTTGLAFPGEFLEDVLPLLGLSRESLVEKPTNRPEIILLAQASESAPADPPTSAPVYTASLEGSGMHMEYWHEIEPVLNKYAATLHKNIFASNPHGKPSDAVVEYPGRLYIRFWSAPAETESTRYFTVFGMELGGSQGDGVEPSNLGTPVADGDDNVVAEIVGNTLYVLFDLPHRRGAGKLMTEIMKQYKSITTLSPAKREAARLAQERRARERSRQAYTEACESRVVEQIARSNNEVKRRAEELEKYQRAIVENIRTIEEQRKHIQFLEASKAEGMTRYAQEFDLLEAIPDIERVKIERGIINVYTKQIDVEYEGSVYDVGKFKISLNPNAGTAVTCHNLTRKVGGLYHPHVDSSGSCCFGNISVGVSKLAAAHEYSVLAQLVIQFLKTANPLGWYGSIKGWPVKPGVADTQESEETK